MMNEISEPLMFNDQPTGYTISSFGNVRDGDGTLCKLGDYKGKYAMFYLKINGKKKYLNIRRLVASHFLDNPNKFNFVQHVDGNPFNNRVDNLRWISQSNFCIPLEIKNKELIEASLNDAGWRPVYINGELTNYSVSINGQIRVANTLKVCSPSMTNGYKTFTLIHNDKKYRKSIHRLVAEAFIPNVEEKKQVNHINYDKLDNRVENLEWVTVSENIKHAHQKAGRKSCRIPVIRRDLDGSEVRYEYVIQAIAEFGAGVSKCLAGRQEKAGGYTWTYENAREKIEIDLNEFKPIQNHPNFLISRDGRIYNSVRKKFLKPGSHGGSYMGVILDKKKYSIHRLIALNFIGKPENYKDNWVVNHKDGNKLNNCINNLEWVSTSENIHHMYKNGCGGRRVRPIIQKDLAGNFIQEHPNAGHASRAIGVPNHGQILRACKIPGKSVIHGYHWEFKAC